MSSRADPRRRDRSWEREDRDRERGGDRDRYSRGGRDGRARGGGSYRDEPRRRSSRSRSPRRDRDGDRRDRRERDYRHGRDDDRRDRERDRYTDDRRRDREDHRRDSHRKDDIDKPMRDATPVKEGESKDRGAARPDTGPSTQLAEKSGLDATTSTRPNLDPDAADHPTEEGEAMEEVNDEESAMLAMMGLNGFGSTKGKHVVGNQIGAVNIKKVRTWRQYMNRRGGFNRPLDKIK